MIVRETRRFFKSSPLLSLTGVLLLSVGVGSSAVALSLLLTFSSPRYPGMRSQGYATIGEGESGSVAMPVPWNWFEKLGREQRGGIRLAAYSPATEVVLGSGSGRKPVRVAAISSGLFSGFADPLAAGRDFTPGEAESAGEHKAILSAALAQSLFGSPSAALGRSVLLNDSAFQITGVAAPAFHGLFGDSAEAWVTADSVVPLQLNIPNSNQAPPSLWKYINAFYFLAASDLESSGRLAANAARLFPLRASDGSSLSVAQGISIDWQRDRTLRRWLRLGLGFSLSLALVSCLNVCLLLLARAPLLVEEVRLKRALGAGTRRIATELATGPAAMMSVGLLASLLLWATAMVVVARLSNVNEQLLLGSAAAVILALARQLFLAFALVLAISLVPAAAALRSSAAPRMGSTATIGPRGILLMQVPVSVQIGCAIGVSILASMIGASVLALARQPLGYDPSHRLVICLTPSNGSIVFQGTTGASSQFLALNRVIERVRMLPGVDAVSYVNTAPFDGEGVVDDLQISDTPSAPPLLANHVLVTSGYFSTIGSKILRGRKVSDWIRTGASNEIAINDSLAGELFHGVNPVGKSVNVIVPARFGLRLQKRAATVVGVVEDTRDAGYASSPQPTFYEEGHAYSDARPHLVVYGEESAHSLEVWTRQAVADFMPGMGLERIYSISDKVNASLAPERFRALGALAGSAVMAAISLIGLYGSLAFYLRAKRREMAVRICLGASPGTIRRMVLVRAFWCAFVGALLSLPMWLVFEKLATNDYLGQVSWSADRAAVITLVCVAGSVLLAMIPAKAAASISPANVLKHQ
jgi:predicted permease